MDATDRALIGALRSNARATWAELGRVVGMSGPSVTDRVQRLEQTGVITGYHAAVEPSAIGLPVAALVGVPIQFLIQFAGLARTTVSHASLMVGNLPVLLAAGSALFAHERVTPKRLSRCAPTSLSHVETHASRDESNDDCY